MSTRRWQWGILCGALLMALTIVALPQEAEATGSRFFRSGISVHRGFVSPHHSFHSRYRFGHLGFRSSSICGRSSVFGRHGFRSPVYRDYGFYQPSSVIIIRR